MGGKSQTLTIALVLGTLGGSRVALAAGPETKVDDSPAAISNRPFETTLFFSSSFGDKYTSHIGGIADLTYRPLETLGVGLSVGFMHGQPSSIVTDRGGIIASRMRRCLMDVIQPCNVSPQLPDQRQITGLLDAIAIWAPVRLDAQHLYKTTIELYLLVGAGINGTRRVQVLAHDDAIDANDYSLEGDGLGDGGFMSRVVANGMSGFGLRILVLDRFVVRAEMRAVFFGGKFDVDSDGKKDTDTTTNYLGQIGVGAVL